MNERAEVAMLQHRISMLELEVNQKNAEISQLKIRLGNLQEIWHDIKVIFPILIQMINVFDGKFVIWKVIFKASFFLKNLKLIRETVFENQTGDEVNPKQGWPMDQQ